jgi:hypothetical protein
MRGHPSYKPVRNTSPLLVTFVLALAACGGKIAGDQRAPIGDDPSRDPTAASGFEPAPAASGTQQPSSPFGAFAAPPSGGLAQPSGGRTVDDACAAICERNGDCGATQTDCKDSCAAEIRNASACSAQANAYIQCYASNLLPGCAALPPVCETAYCAFTICAGKVVPDYCH